MINAGHGDGVKRTSLRTLAAAPAGVFIDDDGIFPEGDAVKGAGVEASRFRALLALDGPADVSRLNDVTAPPTVAALGSQGEPGLAGVTGDAGCHAGLTTDTEFRICLNMIKHG